ncbi:hypothetical protein [Bacillus sp. sid0103]|nr:hypothetical protein [Bacillus sp. sid0103]
MSSDQSFMSPNAIARAIAIAIEQPSNVDVRRDDYKTNRWFLK